MQGSKLLVLPVLLLTSMICAEKVHVQVKLNVGNVTENLDEIVELSDEVHAFTSENEESKVEIVKDGDLYCLEIFVKDEAGDWKLVGKPELVISDIEGKARLLVSDSRDNSIEVVLRVLAD